MNVTACVLRVVLGVNVCVRIEAKSQDLWQLSKETKGSTIHKVQGVLQMRPLLLHHHHGERRRHKIDGSVLRLPVLIPAVHLRTITIRLK